MPALDVDLVKNHPAVREFIGLSATHLGVAAFTLAAVLPGVAMAQERVFRCPGNEYTNDEAKAKSLNCRVIEGASVTIVSTAKPPVAAAPAAPRTPAATANNTRPDNAEQRARDSDARLILEGELKKTEDKLADLKREFNNGEPEKRGEEFRNNQRYLDRVADLRSAIARAETDVSSLKREIARLPGASSGPGVPSGGAVAPLAVPGR